MHNKVIGDLVEVEVGVPGELNGSALGPQETMPVPKKLNYDMWLGPAFPAPYTMQRVHEPGTISSRPGWLRISDYCNGMITNWGAHLNDIALWKMKKEYENPVIVEGTGTFDKGIWHTISAFDLDIKYADGMKLKYKIDVPFVKFIDNKTEGDKRFVEGIRELADFAAPLKIKIAIYPHVGFYCEKLEHAENLVKNVVRENVGAVFNLCHLLKVEGEVALTRSINTWEEYKMRYLFGHQIATR